MNKRKGNKAAEKQYISRAKYVCPVELERMIELIRLVPSDMSLVPLIDLFRNEIFEEMEQSQGDGLFHFLFPNRDEVYLERVLRRLYPNLSPIAFLEKYIEKTPQKFKEYIRPNEPIEFIDPFFGEERIFAGINKEELEETFIFIKMMCRYSDFYRIRLSIQSFVSYIEVEKRRPRPLPTDYPNYSFVLPLNVTVRRETDGKLHLTGLARFIEDGFDDSRLRKCQKCKHIFWAKREDSKTCSKRCLNAYNVYRYRKLTEEEKTKKKEQREANRIYKQKHRK